MMLAFFFTLSTTRVRSCTTWLLLEHVGTCLIVLDKRNTVTTPIPIKIESISSNPNTNKTMAVATNGSSEKFSSFAFFLSSAMLDRKPA